jgi:hypothetical protein
MNRVHAHAGSEVGAEQERAIARHCQRAERTRTFEPRARARRAAAGVERHDGEVRIERARNEREAARGMQSERRGLSRQVGHFAEALERARRGVDAPSQEARLRRERVEAIRVRRERDRRSRTRRCEVDRGRPAAVRIAQIAPHEREISLGDHDAAAVVERAKLACGRVVPERVLVRGEGARRAVDEVGREHRLVLVEDQSRVRHGPVHVERELDVREGSEAIAGANRDRPRRVELRRRRDAAQLATRSIELDAERQRARDQVPLRRKARRELRNDPCLHTDGEREGGATVVGRARVAGANLELDHGARSAAGVRGRDRVRRPRSARDGAAAEHAARRV